MSQLQSQPQSKHQSQYQEYQQQEHPFAQYTRILGKGKQGTRSLTEQEAFLAFKMILDQQVLPEQLGAFMMLLRVKEESVSELVGFVTAVKDYIAEHRSPYGLGNNNKPLLDWPSYAGKKKHHAWYLLSALTLAKHGIKVCMHGAKGHTIGRVYSEDLLQALGQPVASTLQQVPEYLNSHNFCYVPLPLLQPTLSDIINMRNVFGLRSPVHTLARLINPFDAPFTMQSIFHPAYQSSHLDAGKQLGYQNSMVIKGDGGEFERNPDARSKVIGLRDGVAYEFRLPMLNSPKSPIEDDLSPELLQRVWEGSTNRTNIANRVAASRVTANKATAKNCDSSGGVGEMAVKYGQQAITETLALVLITLKQASSYEQALPMAVDMWQARHD